MAKSNYEILGIPENASRNEIRSAFRSLALKHHADRGGQDEEFIIIKQAFEDLKVGKKYPDSLVNQNSFGELMKKKNYDTTHYFPMTLHKKSKLGKNG